MKGLLRKALLIWHVLRGRRLGRAWSTEKELEAMDPNIGPVLILAPHPDDEVIGCGSALLAYRKTNTPVTIAFITDGRRSSHPVLRGEALGAVRMQEAALVCAEVGAALVGPAVPEASELPEKRVTDWLAELVSTTNPAVVYVPFPLDAHPNHRQVSYCLAKAAASHRGLIVRWYEVNVALTPMLATTYCETMGLMSQRRRLASLYVSQNIDFDTHFAQLFINAASIRGSWAVEWYMEVPATETFRWVRECETFLRDGYQVLPTMMLRRGIINCRRLAPCYEVLAKLKEKP